MSGTVQAKRAAPARLTPLAVGHLVVRPLFEDGTGGYAMFLLAQTADGKEIKWKTKLYERLYQMDIEKDVQEIHLTSLTLEDHLLLAVDERDQHYKIQPESGRLIEPTPSRTYKSFDSEDKPAF